MEEFLVGMILGILILWFIYRQVLKRNPKFRVKKFRKARKQICKWR